MEQCSFVISLTREESKLMNITICYFAYTWLFYTSFNIQKFQVMKHLYKNCKKELILLITKTDAISLFLTDQFLLLVQMSTQMCFRLIFLF